MKSICAWVSLAFLFTASAAAGVENTQRLCKDSDLVGTYKLADLREDPKGAETKWFHDYNHHYLVFHTNKTYDFVAARHAIPTPEALQKAINQSAGVGERIAERKFTLDNTGLLDLYLDGKLDYSYRCMVVIKSFAGGQVNDLMLTGYSKFGPSLYKLFRHWP